MNALWPLLLALALLWPSRVLSPFGGMPLTGAGGAVLIALVFPVLWWLDRSFLTRRMARMLIVALAFVKIGAWVSLPQHGLCAQVTTAAPFTGTIHTIAVDEPAGVLRSWDVRTDWTAPVPRCTAVFERPYRSQLEFPAWYLNLVGALRPNARNLNLRVTGYLQADQPGSFLIETGSAMDVDGTIGSNRVSTANGSQITASLPAGIHAIDLRGVVHGDDWKFVPLWNGRDAWSTVRLTTTPPTRIDRVAAPIAAALTSVIVVVLAIMWFWSCATARRWSTATIVWAIAVSAVFAICGATGRFARVVPLILPAAAFLPIETHERQRRGAFMLLGLPWLALAVARSWEQIGHVTIYSLGDDWQFYQAAAYRIVMNGYWIQGGSPTFYVQPLYRWVVGLLHLLFGDSSAGESFLDAVCLLGAALVIVHIVRRVAGYRWGVVAGAATLATFTVSPIWYLIGRGLSEITALGMMSAAMVLLMRARCGSVRAGVAAGVWATAMFYTRLNHLLITGFLLAWMMPLRTAAQWRDVVAAVHRIRLRPVGAYIAVVCAGFLLLVVRNWWYTGHFSFVYGTSYAVQRTGFAWAQIGESLGAQLSMREPPALYPRAAFVAGGTLLAALALMQVPAVVRMPAPLAIMTFGTVAGSFIAYTHDYPGRMSLHVVPFAVAMSACMAAQLTARS